MDPLSISCAIATFGAVSIKLGKFVGEAYNAPKEILMLSAEVTTLDLLIKKLGNSHTTDVITQAWRQDLHDIFFPFLTKSKELADLIQHFERSDGTLCFKDRIKWPLARSKAQLLSTNLRYIRLDIITHLTVQSS